MKVSYNQHSQERGDLVWLLDFANPDNNEFIVANQFTVIENQQNKRPDLVLFVNGLPLVVVELKNPTDENATIKAAYQQLDTYKHTIPSLFTYNALLVISDGLEAKAGSLSADLSRFMAWKTVGADCIRPNDDISENSDYNKGACNAPLQEIERAKAKWTQMEALIGSEQRINNIVQDIVSYFEARQEVFAGKGMIVSMSRRIAVDLYEAIIKIKPEWHSDELNKGVIKVVMTAASSDGYKLAKHHTTKQQRRHLATRIKDNNDELKLVIVRDMWLTGFDAPSLHTLYIDKPMQGHSLMQAIARVCGFIWISQRV